MNCGSPSWVRTNDLRINSPSLYRLSYRGIKAVNYTQHRQGTQESYKKIVEEFFKKGQNFKRIEFLKVS